MKTFAVFVAVVVLVVFLSVAMLWDLSLPTVWYDLRGEKLCAFDSGGNRIALDSVGKKYDLGGYAKQCPS